MNLKPNSSNARLESVSASYGGVPPTDCARKPAAFSLVEVLVVTTLLALIVLALMDVFSTTQRAFRASMTQSDVLEGSRAAMELIATDLRGMTPSGGTNDIYGIGPVNFFSCCETNFNSWNPSYNYNPLEQSLPGSTTGRYNQLNYFFVLGRQNTQWTGTGYVVNGASVVNGVSANPLFPLYRFYAVTNITQSPRTLFDLFRTTMNNAVINGNWSGLSHVMDGVVHLVVRPYDANGIWLTNGYSSVMPRPFNVQLIPGYNGEEAFYFLSNAIPASVGLELGVVEDRTLARAESLPNNLPLAPPNDRQTLYLQNQAGAVHVFHQQVTLPNVDRSAYP